jgi:hypothetical protein
MAMKDAMESFANKFVECLSPILQVDKANTLVLATNRNGTQLCTI